MIEIFVLLACCAIVLIPLLAYAFTLEGIFKRHIWGEDDDKREVVNERSTYYVAVCHDCKRQRIFPYTLPDEEKFIKFLKEHSGHNMEFIPNGELDKEMIWED